MELTNDPVLKRFRGALDALYGDRIDRVVLYGSRARGDAGPQSDYDIAVFLRDSEAFGAEVARLAGIEADILIEMGAVINAMPLKADAYTRRTGFMEEVRRDGVDL